GWATGFRYPACRLPGCAAGKWLRRCQYQPAATITTTFPPGGWPGPDRQSRSAALACAADLRQRLALPAGPEAASWRPLTAPPGTWLGGAPGRSGVCFGVPGRQAPATMARMSLKKQSARALRGVAWRIDRPPKSRRRQAAPPQAAGPLLRDSAPGSRTAARFFDQFPR